MNEAERAALGRWCASAKEVESKSFFDGVGNVCSTRIYKKRGRYYRVEFCLAKPCVGPVEVTPRRKRVTVTEWVEKKRKA